MATQLPAAVAAPAKIDPNAALVALKPMLNAQGELALGELMIAERMAQFAAFQAASNCNLPMWSTNLLTQFPAGTTLLPLPLIPQRRDAWRDADARAMKLKDGHVEPSADFIIQLGNLAGVRLDKVFEGPIELDNIKMYSVRYIASLRLPSGEILTTPGEEGKDQALYTGQGTMQAHIAESTRKKAKRNAIKCLLGIPTTLLAEEFDRPWIILRPVFRAGVSAEADAIIAEQKALNAVTTQRLYGELPASAQTVDVSASAMRDGELDANGMIIALQGAASLPDLDALAGQIEDMRLTGGERKALAAAYKRRKADLTPAQAGEQADPLL